MTAVNQRAVEPYWVVVPAAGSGKRMGADKPKQYLPLLGKPLIVHTLQNILSWPGLAGIVVAIAADDSEFQALPEAADPRIHTVTGGAERADSVLAALEYLSNRAVPDTSVLVHDAARPLVAKGDIEKLIGPGSAAIALLAQPASDTVKRAAMENGTSVVAETVPRDQIWLAQTPQKAPLQLLKDSLQTGLLENPAAITDEASALELAGYRPQLIAACRTNFKVTQPADLLLAEALLQQQRTQQGEPS